MKVVEIKVEGMMCPHCVARVDKACRSVVGVNQVEVSLENKTATIEGESFDIEAIKKAIIDAGYEVKGAIEK